MKKTLLLVAMKQELKDALNEASLPSYLIKPFDIPMWSLPTSSGEILTAQVGIGPINASSVFTAILTKTAIDEVILLGLGGAIAPELKIGDSSISTDIIQHDAIYSQDHAHEYMACGEPHISLKPEDRANIRTKADTILSEELSTYLKSKGHIIHRGAILSGSEFVGSLERKLALKKAFPDALMVDMEACSIAYLCKKANIPFTVIKTVADTVSKTPTSEYLQFLNSSQKKALDVVGYLTSR